MKRTIIILIVLVIGCGTRTTKPTSENREDSIIMYFATETVTSLDNEAEDFNVFFKTFTTDSLFQIAQQQL